MGLSVINWDGVTNHQLSESSKYPLQTDIATKEFQRIEALRASTSQYGLTKLSTATDVTDVNAAVLSASEKNPNVSGSIAADMYRLYNELNNELLNQYSCTYFNGTGWYRVVELQYTYDGQTRAAGLSLDIELNRGYYNNSPEYHLLTFIDLYEDCKFFNKLNYSHSHLLRKIRIVTEQLTGKGYVDVFNTMSVNNRVRVGIANYRNIEHTFTARAINPPYAVDETLPSNYSLRCLYDIPANT